MRRAQSAWLSGGHGGWTRRFAKFAAVMIGLVALGPLGLRGYGDLRLMFARRALASVLTTEELESMHALANAERPAMRLATAIGPLAEGKPEGDELLSRCRTVLDTWATLRGDMELAPELDGATPGVRVTELKLKLHPTQALALAPIAIARTSSMLRRCALDAAGGPSPELTLPAVELLGTVARDLERGPSLLTFAYGLSAEKHQLRIIERLHAGAAIAPGDRARLESALVTEDLERGRRLALVGEAAIALGAGDAVAHGEPMSRKARLLMWVVAPLAAAAHVDEINRILCGEASAPAWIDTFFVGARGLQGSWERLLAAPTELALRRQHVRRLLAL